ncbi:hypothetical protein [Planomonospora parontospora]|uniref:hypothetical protein n=1 Tax=Planomonospora parontospora TaxID=58119 RepID=UPI001670F340|nr:hypothetical protein [Planomonospora parontospora]GGL37306.1 hypothetical protein GCM10014719_43040 [Planomonospora parontospora subsp. antibiotica]GII17601.1 hypothetical protein Ppa05_43270 [Planomonospora parontospora subsp. antibiotica]
MVGLARSDSSAEKTIAAAGSVVQGDMSDHDVIVEQAKQADAVAHLAFTLDFSKFGETVENELQLLTKVAAALEGIRRPHSLPLEPVCQMAVNDRKSTTQMVLIPSGIVIAISTIDGIAAMTRRDSAAPGGGTAVPAAPAGGPPPVRGGAHRA